MTKLVSINDELEHDDTTYKKQMYNKEKKIQHTINRKIKEKHQYSDKVYNETFIHTAAGKGIS